MSDIKVWKWTNKKTNVSGWQHYPPNDAEKAHPFYKWKQVPLSTVQKPFFDPPKPSVIQGEGKGAQHKEHNIKYLGATTTMNAEQALHQALTDDLDNVLVIAYAKNGDLVIRSSRMSRAEALWLTERARLWALGDGQ